MNGSRNLLFEFEDQPWLPDRRRDGVTDYLHYGADKVDLYKNAIPLIQRGIEASESKEIVDLCSGGGGIPAINKKLRDLGTDARITMTDKYPNASAFGEISRTDGNIRFVSESVDALKVPRRLRGLRTMFASFHHFRFDAASEILQNAVDAREPIIIFEFTERTWFNLAGVLLSPLTVLALTPFIRPFRLARLLFTYVIPLIPFIVLWDGLVSVARTYTPAEMTKMTAQIDGTDGYEWEIGRVRAGISFFGMLNVLYLMGRPT